MWETRVQSLRWEDPLEKEMATHSSTLAWRIPWMEESGWLQSMGSLSRTRLSNFTFTFHFHTLEKAMATYSSVLAWRIPGTGKPGGLPSMGSYRVGHKWSDLAAAAASCRLTTAPWQNNYYGPPGASSSCSWQSDLLLDFSSLCLCYDYRKIHVSMEDPELFCFA